jgi:threonyl-tRNA synthetase
MVKDALGRKWQLGTIQVDYNLPQRFELEYTGADNQKHRPVMIHRAPFGSLERFIAVLLEHTAGNFPLWLMPEQVTVLPVSDRFNNYAKKVLESLKFSDIRTLIDDRSEKIGRKIRDAEVSKIPFMLVIGEKEVENETIAVRKHREGDLGVMKLNEFIQLVQDAEKQSKNPVVNEENS